MKVQFKYPRAIDGVEYQKGIHELPDELKGHWFFLALVNNGDCVLVGHQSGKPKELKKIEALKAPSHLPQASQGEAAIQKVLDEKDKILSSGGDAPEGDDGEKIIDDENNDEIIEDESHDDESSDGEEMIEDEESESGDELEESEESEGEEQSESAAPSKKSKKAKKKSRQSHKGR